MFFAKVIGYCKLRYSAPHDQVTDRKYGHLNAVVVITAKNQLSTKSVADVLDSKILLERNELELVNSNSFGVTQHASIISSSLVDLSLNF